MNAVTKEKSRLREWFKQQRGAIREEIRLLYDEAIFLRLFSLPQMEMAECVFCFISSGTEVDTYAIIRQLLKSGKTIAVPKILGANGMLAIPFQNWDELERGQLGIFTPIRSDPIQKRIDISITPGLGFTPSGKRLGFGRGYYDKWFAQHPQVEKIAIAYECQLTDDLPTDEFDVAVDIIVTEERIIEVAQTQD